MNYLRLIIVCILTFFLLSCINEKEIMSLINKDLKLEKEIYELQEQRVDLMKALLIQKEVLKAVRREIEIL